MFKFKLESYLNYKQSVENIKKTETQLAQKEFLESEKILADYEKEKRDILRRRADIEKQQLMTQRKVDDFVCPTHGAVRYIMEQACNEPKCSLCGWMKKSCS